MTTAANPLTINDWANWQPRWPSVCRNLAWPIYLRFFALAGAGAVNLCVGPVWLSELNRTEPVGGPPTGTSRQCTAGLIRKAGRGPQADSQSATIVADIVH